MMAFVGWCFGLEIKKVSFGVGFQLFRLPFFKKFIVSTFPFGGYVKFLGSNKEFDADGLIGFSELQPLKQALITISGCLMLLIISLRGISIKESFWVWFQAVDGAISPFQKAQIYISMCRDYYFEQGLLATGALMSGKIAFLNLVPLGCLNGGQAIIQILKTWLDFSKIDKYYMGFSVLVLLLILISWCIALMYFVVF